VAKNLTDEEIQSLGSYVQGLHARPTGTSASASGHWTGARFTGHYGGRVHARPPPPR